MGYRLPPPLNDFYGRAGNRLMGMCRCTIIAIDGGMLTVADVRGGATTTLTVLLPANDPHATTTDLSVGDVVIIAGEREGDLIRAFGVQKRASGAEEMRLREYR